MHSNKFVFRFAFIRNMTTVIGIDPGTATTGWAVLEEKNGEIKSVAYGHISTSPKKSEEERLFEISADLEKIIEKYRPQEAAVEKLFFFKNQKTVMEVSQARGAIVLTIAQKNVNLSSYTPLQVKQAITGYGRAEKRQVQEMIKNILKLKSIPKPDDVADALAIALCHINSRKINSYNT
jgi:crossover junction endodeoxyribonuclease RuvC